MMDRRDFLLRTAVVGAGLSVGCAPRRLVVPLLEVHDFNFTSVSDAV